MENILVSLFGFLKWCMMRIIKKKSLVTSKKAMNNNVYKNYIFDFYGTLVDILTDEKDPML